MMVGVLFPNFSAPTNYTLSVHVLRISDLILESREIENWCVRRVQHSNAPHPK